MVVEASDSIIAVSSVTVVETYVKVYVVSEMTTVVIPYGMVGRGAPDVDVNEVMSVVVLAGISKVMLGVVLAALSELMVKELLKLSEVMVSELLRLSEVTPSELLGKLLGETPVESPKDVLEKPLRILLVGVDEFALLLIPCDSPN